VLLDRVPVTSDAGAISRVVSMAQDPTTDTLYVIVQRGVRRLATIEPTTGVATQLGSLGDSFASLAFDATGQLWGVTGSSGLAPRTLYRIDKTDGTRTLGRALNLGSGACIAHHPTENALYHWANGLAKIDITAPGLDITPIPTTGLLPNEPTSCVFDPSPVSDSTSTV